MEAAGKSGKAAREREAKERSTSHNPKECPVCMTVYDDTVQRPRTLPCGHTVCALCVNKLKQQGHVTCPECRVSHAVPEGGQFSICYAVETFIRIMGETEKAAAPSPPPSAMTGKGAAAAAGQKEAATLRGWDEQQQQLEDRLQGLLDQSRSARELMRQEESRAAAKKEEVREGERQLHAALETLRTPATDKEASVAVVEASRCTDEAKEVLEEYRGSFPDANTATTVRKVRGAGSPEKHLTVPEKEPLPQSEADFTLMDSLYDIEPPNLKAEDLRSPTQPVRRLLEAGRVFGVHQVEGQRRHARIRLEAGQLYLHNLKEEPLPPGATAIPVSQLVPPSPPCMVFLDLSWPGIAPRRVHIRLSPDTPRGRQAVLLCTGQRGPSYAGTRLLDVSWKGQPGEYVHGGDYESNDGEGGAALLPDLGEDEDEYRGTGKAGAVWGRWSRGDPSRGAQFAITTRGRQVGWYDLVFGEVVQGLDAVVAAAQHTPITEVNIKNCGVVLRVMTCTTTIIEVTMHQGLWRGVVE